MKQPRREFVVIVSCGAVGIQRLGDNARLGGLKRRGKTRKLAGREPGISEILDRATPGALKTPAFGVRRLNPPAPIRCNMFFRNVLRYESRAHADAMSSA
jgi:hypothetical protein